MIKMTLGRWPIRRTYRLNPSLSALLRYRSAFGVSFFRDFFESADGLCLARLVWASMEGDGPPYHEFVRRALKSRGFAETAHEVQAAALQTTGKKRNAGGDAADEFDELDILAMMAASGISMELAHDLPVFLVLEVISRRTAIMGGGRKDTAPMRFKKMQPGEVRELYGG